MLYGIVSINLIIFGLLRQQMTVGSCKRTRHHVKTVGSCKKTRHYCWVLNTIRNKAYLTYYLRQGIAGGSRNESNIGFSMERFADDFPQFCSATFKIFLLSGLLSTFSSISSVPGSSLKFANFLSLKPLPFGNNNLLLFHLWWMEFVLKCDKFYIYISSWLPGNFSFGFSFFENARKFQKRTAFNWKI